MKTRTVLVLLAMLMPLVALQVATVRAQSPTPTPPATVIPAKVVENSSAHPGWRRYQFGVDPTFSVILPVAPEATAEHAAGSTTAVVQLYISTNETAVYGASRLDGLGLNLEKGSEAERKGFFGRYIEGFARGFQESLKKNNIKYEMQFPEPTRVTAAGREAFQQDFTVGSFNGRAQLIFAGSGAFCVLSVWNPQASAADREAFFNSFQLTGIPK